jgi:CelD/BcsL family acetyltransferase involved in cellulose biosynthesis
MLRLLHLRSLDALLTHAAAWDDLWRRSDVTIPTVQARLVAQWVRQFGPRALGSRAFQALAIEEDGQFVAALPLCAQRLGGWLAAGGLTGNAWTPAADLLVDPNTNREAVLDHLARAVSRLPWQLLWLDNAIIDAPRWQDFLAACERVGWSHEVQERFRISQVEIAGSWDEYRATWSKNHRQNMPRYRRKLCAAQGDVSLRVLRPQSSEDIAAALRRGFEIENRSWKGAARSAVLKSPGMFEFFTQQAELLAEQGQLELAFLDAGGRPIAFHYAWRAKNVYHPFKCGYDEAFAAFSPGQLLIDEVLRAFFATGETAVFDCVGPATDFTRKWQTREYTVGRVAIAPGRLLGQAVLAAYKHVWPTLKAWRPEPRRSAPRVANERT